MIGTAPSHRYGQYWFLWYSIAGLAGESRVYPGVKHPGDGIAGVAIGYGITRDVITASKGGDQAEKGATVRNRCGGLTGQSLEYGVSDERASREDGAVSRR